MTTDAATQRSWFRRLRWPAVRVLVIAAAAGLAVWRVDWGTLVDAFRMTDWYMLLAAVAANFVSVLFKGMAWKAVIDALPSLRRKTRLKDLLSPLMVGFLFNTVLAARLGEVAKVLLAKRRLSARGESIPTTVLLGTVVVENLVSIVSWVLLVIGIGLFLPLPSYAWIVTIVLGVLAVTVLVVALLSSPSRQVPPWLDTGPIWQRATRALSRIWGAVRESHLGLRRPRQMVKVLVPSFATWLAQWAGIYCTLLAFGLGEVGWGGAGLLLVTITLAQTFPVLPGNLVVFQAAAVVPLTASYGVSAADALAFSIVLQATEAAVGVAIGFIFLLVEGVSFKELRREAEEEEQELERREAPVDTLAGH